MGDGEDGMGERLVGVVAVVVAGCAHQPEVVPRIALGEAKEARGTGQASHRVEELLTEHRMEIASCFDELEERRETRARIRVELAVQLREGGLVVSEVKPLDASSVTDMALLSCLADRLARWPVVAGDADVVVPLAVAPRISALGVAAEERAAEAPRLVPEQRRFE